MTDREFRLDDLLWLVDVRPNDFLGYDKGAREHIFNRVGEELKEMYELKQVSKRFVRSAYNDLYFHVAFGGI